MNLNTRLLRYAFEAGSALLLTVLMGLLGACFIIMQARILSTIIATVFIEGSNLKQVVVPMFALLGIIGLRSLVSYLGDISAAALALKVKSRLRSLLVEKIIGLGPVYIQRQNSGELSASLVQGIEALDAYFSQYLPQLLLAALVPLIILVAVFPLDWITGIVLLVTAPLIPFFMVLIGNTAESLTRRQWTALGRLSAVFLDTLQGLTTLKALNQSEQQAEKIASSSEQYRTTTLSVLRVAFLSALVLELVSTISTAIVAVQVGLRLLYGQMAFVDGFFVLVITPDFYLSLRMLGQRFHASISGVSAAARIFSILDDPSCSTHEKKTPVLWKMPLKYSLRFEDVGYQYPGRDKTAIDNITFEIISGQQVALVGLSGSGKSTLAQLLLRFVDPCQGRIVINDQPILEIPVKNWRAGIAWVPQMPYFFNDTLAANIRIGRPEAAMEEVMRAARLSHLDDFISTLPQGYDTVIGERNSRLSGGQAQRLALARAFIKDAPLLILDEPNEHLDPEEQLLLDEATRRLYQGRTVIIIAHHLPTVARADQIIVLDAGRIAEKGAHGSLLQHAGLYSRLVRAGGG